MEIKSNNITINLFFFRKIPSLQFALLAAWCLCSVFKGGLGFALKGSATVSVPRAEQCAAPHKGPAVTDTEPGCVALLPSADFAMSPYLGSARSRAYLGHL